MLYVIHVLPVYKCFSNLMKYSIVLKNKFFYVLNVLKVNFTLYIIHIDRKVRYQRLASVSEYTEFILFCSNALTLGAITGEQNHS